MPKTLSIEGVKVVVDNLNKVIDAIQALVDHTVLVGVPADKGLRSGSGITNAALAYIHETGSPVRNIPARPFLAPGIKAVQSELANILEEGAGKALKGDKAAVLASMNRAGLLAVNSIRKKITDGPFVPLSPVTLAARKRKGFKGTKPLIVTGQLRRSINYVVRPSTHKKLSVERPPNVKGDGKIPLKEATKADLNKLHERAKSLRNKPYG